jgi:hypothetical protein
MLTPNRDGIPESLKRTARWLIWKLELRDPDKWRQPAAGTPGEDAFTKVPYQAARPSSKASSTDPSTWSDFETAWQAYAWGAADGIGFVLGDGWFGVDVDECLTPTGLTPLATEVVALVDSYTERSPREIGLHIICRGTWPDGGRKVEGLEAYPDRHYFTITGCRVDGTRPDPEDRSQALAALHARYFRRPDGTRGGDTPSASTPVREPRDRQRADAERARDAGIVAVPPPLTRDDEQLLRMAAAARNGEKFRRLFRGDISGYRSQSEADMGLVQRLVFWTRGDAAAIDRIFRQSLLYRRKWDRRTGDTTYGAWTIAKALATARAVRRLEHTRPPRAATRERDAAHQRARAFLLDALRGGPRLARDVLAAAAAVGIANSTLDRARRDLGFGTRRRGFGPDAFYIWSLAVARGSARALALPWLPPGSAASPPVAASPRGSTASPLGLRASAPGFSPRSCTPLRHWDP